MESQIEAYIQKQKSPQKEIILKVRKIFQETLPILKETKAWGVITYGDGKFYLGAVNDRVHVGFAITGLSTDEVSFFEGNGKTTRHIKIRTIADVDEDKLVKLIKLVDGKANCKPC